jgi:hypothetical protein
VKKIEEVNIERVYNTIVKNNKVNLFLTDKYKNIP